MTGLEGTRAFEDAGVLTATFLYLRCAVHA